MSTKCYMYESVKLICCLTFWSWSTSFILFRKRRKKKKVSKTELDSQTDWQTDWQTQRKTFVNSGETGSGLDLYLICSFFRNRYILMLYHFVKLKVTEIVTKKHNTAYLKLTLFILNGSNPLSYLSVTI